MEDDLLKQAKEAGYTAVGFGVLAVQKLNVAGRAIAKDVATGLRGLNAGDSVGGKAGVRRMVRRVETAVDPVLDGVERRLPGGARTAFHRARSVTRTVERILL